jgi:cytochrome c-type biogenesis protein CcmH
MRAALAALAFAALAFAAASPAAARVSVSEIEAEVMCPICGTLLELADSPQARREKAYIARLAAAGRSKEQIKDALVAQYGREVLAVPGGSGFDLTAYLVPAVAFVAAAIALAIGVARWRRRAAHDRGDAPRSPSGEEAERLDRDISRYDL